MHTHSIMTMTRSLAVLLALVAAVSAHAAADLQIFGQTGQAPAGSAFQAHMSFFVVNRGPDTSGPIKVRMTFPEGTVFPGLFPGDVPWTCATEGASVVCTRPPLLAEHGDSRNFTVTASAPIAPGTYDVVFELLDAEGDPNLDNNRSVVPLVVYHQLDVTTDADSGPGSLRAAIEFANANCHDGILCHITGPREGEMTIRPLSPLPPITACGVSMNAGSNSIYWEHRRITLDGSLLQAGNGLEVRTACPAGTPGVSISGFAIGNFPGNGIVLATQDEDPCSSRHGVIENVIGLDKVGLEPRPNGQRGVSVESPRTCASINFNWIGANRASGIAIWGAAPATVVFSNHIGWGHWLQPRANGNGASGVFINANDVHVVGNNIAFNGQFGVSIMRGVQRPDVRNNVVHSNVEPAIDWGLDRETPNDPDESDGIPNKPVITSVTTSERNVSGFREITARVAGVVRSRTGVYGSRYIVNVYVSGGPGLHGRYEAFSFVRSVEVFPDHEGTFEAPFETDEVRFFTKTELGFTAQLVVQDQEGRNFWSSELSDPYVVP